MPVLIPVMYNGRAYPDGIEPQIKEIAFNFDKEPLRAVNMAYSMHTEYSYFRRPMQAKVLDEFPVLRAAVSENGIPELWKSEAWAREFAAYVVRMAVPGQPPAIIEIHPPFGEYSSFPRFFELYAVFEELVTGHFPDVKILIENRSGTRYKGKGFILSTLEHLLAFSELLRASRHRLRIALDVPQVFTAHHMDRDNQREVVRLVERFAEIRDCVDSLHLWGKKYNDRGQFVSHCGDLNTYMHGDQCLKAEFLSMLAGALDDGKKRYFVPEVNSGKVDLHSVVNDVGEHFTYEVGV